MEALFPGNLHLRVSTCRMFVLIFLLHAISDKTVKAQSGKVWCEVPSVEALKETVLTCHFPEDVSQTKKDVSVYLYTENESPDAVVDCWWLGGKLECYGAPGYKYTTKISNVLNVTITRAAANQTGTYSCQLAGYGASKLSTCDFRIQSGSKTLCDVPNVNPGSSTSVSCYFSEEVSNTKRDFNVYHFPIQGGKEAVLRCEWKQGSLICNTSPGYQFDRRVTNTLSVKLPRVSDNHNGTYSCQLTGSPLGAYENCTFNFDKGKASTCIADAKPMDLSTITCIFDIDVNKSRTNFSIVHISDQHKTGTDVLRCHWLHNNLTCETKPCYEYVTGGLTVKVLRANLEDGDLFKYRLQTSANSSGTCQTVMDSKTDNMVPVIVGVVIAVFIFSTVLLVLLLLYFRRRHRKTFFAKFRQRKDTSCEEQLPMNPVQAADPTTEKLQATLCDSIKDKYPDIFSKFYFVPALYVNRNTYKSADVAGEKVFVLEPTQEAIMRHDRAIQHVLKCLRQLAERDNEVMFVLSQFTYDNYLASVGEDFSHHSLPMPSALRQHNEHYGDFDVLIVHRQHGLVAVVVNASGWGSDIGVDVRDEEPVKNMRSAIKQLNEAGKMLRHLLSDQRPHPLIRKTLMLPNLSLQSLRQTLNQHQSLVTDLRDCFELPNKFNVDGECLCVDQLSADNVLDQLKEWLQRHTSGSEVDVSFSESQYVTTLSRFCGPTTRLSFTMPGDNSLTFTPTTLQHAVQLTGELFNGTIIHPEHYDVLTKASPRAFLFGPPGTGKTTSLVLMGKKWLSEGHRVCVLSTWRESRIPSKLLYEALGKFTGKSENPSWNICLTFEDLNLEAQDMQKAVKKVMKLSTPDGLFILADDAGPYVKQDSSFQRFCEMLLAKQKNLHLWAASRLAQETPSNNWEKIHFRGNVSCPPTLLRELHLMKLGDTVDRLIKWDPDMICKTPTDGLPIKYIYHSDSHPHRNGYPFVCSQCCLDVIAFLKSLGIRVPASDNSFKRTTVSRSNSKATNSDAVPANTSTPRLYMTDVLFLCLNDDFEKTTFVKTLKASGINMKVVEEEDALPSLHKHSDQHVWVGKGQRVRGMKRKVVVYVEGQAQHTQVPTEWIRLTSLTSCTSQLIWVRDKS